MLGVDSSLVQKLRAGNYCLYQRREAVTIRNQFGFHSLDLRFIRELERPPKSEGQQFAAEIVKKIFLTMLADVAEQAIEAPRRVLQN